MKKYLVVVKTYDGEFEYLDKTIMALDCDPNDSKQVLIEYTGDEGLEDLDGYGRYTSESDYRHYLLYFTKEVQEEHVAILKEYLF
jgi:hypothetical protein